MKETVFSTRAVLNEEIIEIENPKEGIIWQNIYEKITESINHTEGRGKDRHIVKLNLVRSKPDNLYFQVVCLSCGQPGQARCYSNL